MTSANATASVLGLSNRITDQNAIVRKLNWGRWLTLTLVVAGIALFCAFGPDDQTVIHRSAEWREAARNNLFAALLLFFITEVLLIAFSVPVGIWLTALAGFLFGLWMGTAVVSLAGTLGAMLAFLSARYLLAEKVHRFAQTRPRFARWLTSIDEGFRDHGAYYVLLLRLTPIIPFFVVNFGLGLTSVRTRDYWWATQLGMLPLSLVIASAGASLAEISSFRELLSLRLLGPLCLLPLALIALHYVAGRWMNQRS